MTLARRLFPPLFLLAFASLACGEPAPYLRTAKGKEGGRVLEVAVRTLASPKENGPRVTLLGVSHLGDAAYYEKVQKKLDAADLVLFEGVGFGDDGPPKRDGGGSAVSGIQVSLARSMGLVFQLEAIRYDRPHFRNSDLSTEALLTRLQGGPLKPSKKGAKGKAPEDGLQSREFTKALSGNSFLFDFLGKTLALFGENPKFRALMKLAIMETLGSIEGDVTRLAKSSGPGMEKFMKVLLEDRNTIVFRDLRKVLKKKNPPKSIVVFYGAAHMPDLENRLARKFGFRPAGDEWLAAFGVDPEKAGLSAFELGLVRSMIRMQLRQVYSQSK